MSNITARMQNFIDGVVDGKSLSDAYRENYDCSRMLATTVNRRAHALAKEPGVSAEIARLRAEASAATVRNVTDVANEFLRVAFADPGRIVQHRRLCCRHCWGIDHAYQWKDDREFAHALRQHEEQETIRLAKRGPKGPPVPVPTDEGGYGFAFNSQPHPTCPSCRGEGYPDVFIADTQSLSPEERRLIKKVKVTKDGIEIQFRDQQDALTKAGQMLGGFKQTVVFENPDGTPVHAAPVVVALSPDEAMARYKAWMEGEK